MKRNLVFVFVLTIAFVLGVMVCPGANAQSADFQLKDKHNSISIALKKMVHPHALDECAWGCTFAALGCDVGYVDCENDTQNCGNVGRVCDEGSVCMAGVCFDAGGGGDHPPEQNAKKPPTPGK